MENYKKFLLKIQGKAVKDIVKSDLSLVIIPTMLCNLKCSYCFVQKQVKNVCMSKETIDKIIHLIGANNGKYSVEWFGGEPTLSADLINYFYSEANKKNYINRFSLLISNGTFENNLCWDTIENYITSIQITIDGPLEIHNKRRIYKNGKGSFEKVIKNLDILYSKINNGIIKNNLTVIIRCNIDKINYNSYFELKRFLENRYNYRFFIQNQKFLNAVLKNMMII